MHKILNTFTVESSSYFLEKHKEIKTLSQSHTQASAYEPENQESGERKRKQGNSC